MWATYGVGLMVHETRSCWGFRRNGQKIYSQQPQDSDANPVKRDAIMGRHSPYILCTSVASTSRGTPA